VAGLVLLRLAHNPLFLKRVTLPEEIFMPVIKDFLKRFLNQEFQFRFSGRCLSTSAKKQKSLNDAGFDIDVVLIAYVDNFKKI
jgi:hypothetical protein